MLIGFIAYYLLRARGENAKKQVKKAPPPTSSDEERPSLDDLLRKLQEQMEPPKSKVKPIEVVEPVAEEKVPEKRPSRPVRTSVRSSKKSVIKPVELEVDPVDERSDFDLRQAVINDAILNRPYQ